MWVPIAVLLTVLVTMLWFGARTALATHCAGGPEVCGQNSGLVHFKKDAIGATLLWPGDTKGRGHGRKGNECPLMMIWMRPSEYKPKDYVNPRVGGVFSGFNPKYLERVQGGIGLGPLDESGWSRYAPDLDRENAQLIDVCGLQALIDKGVFTKSNIVDLTDADMALSDPFFENAGFSKGLGWNIFCMGHLTGIDGRLYNFGFHDKRGNNGGRKVNIFDPKAKAWLPRPQTCVRTGWEADPNGTIPPHCDPLDEDNTDPAHPSDMKYKRWYPAAVTLPDGKILILGGSNTEEGQDPELIRQVVPEVYDPKTDRTIALENAGKAQPMFPRSHVVQTGPRKNDWKVCSLGEIVIRPGGGYDPFLYDGRTSCLDVQAALADPDRDVPAEKHWTFIDTATIAHDSGASVMMVTINGDGTSSQEMWAFGGSDNVGPAFATVEKINFSAAAPKWQPQTPLSQIANQNNVVALPTGDMLVVGGRAGGGVGNSLHYQLYRPDGTRTDLISSNVPRHDHSTAMPQKNGGVWIMGGNRTDLLPSAQRNLSVPVMEYYQPPYLFQGQRPVLDKAPDKIRYGKKFKVKVSGKGDIGAVAIIRTGGITHNWSWDNRYVRLPFHADHDKHDRKDDKDVTLEVKAPHLPGLAVPGDYILFVASKSGVPSEGRHVRLLPSDDHGDHDKDRDEEEDND